MKLKKNICLLLLFSFCFHIDVFAQRETPEPSCAKSLFIPLKGNIEHYKTRKPISGVKILILSSDESVRIDSVYTDKMGNYKIYLCTDTLIFFKLRFIKNGYVSKFCILDFRSLDLENNGGTFALEISPELLPRAIYKDQSLLRLSERIPAAQASYSILYDNLVWDNEMIEVFKEVRNFFNSHTKSNSEKDSIENINYLINLEISKSKAENDSIENINIKKNLEISKSRAEKDSIKNINVKKSLEISKLNEENLTQKNQKIIFFFLIVMILVVLGFIIFFFIRTRKSRNVLSSINKVIENKNLLLEEKQKEITDSINYAKRIQTTLLENVKEMECFKHDYFIFFLPKDIVSGDFYWMKRLGNNFFVSVCDSTGHGVPGAFMSLLNSSMMNEAVVTKNISDPGSIFDSTRSGLMATLSHENSKDGMDAILMNFSDNTIKYAAANNKPVLVRKGELTELKCDKMPVGYSENSSPFQTLDIEAQSGDMIYLYTDGFADQFGGPKGKKFKYANLNKLLVSISEKQLSEQKQVLQNALREWMGDLEQVDDICIVGIRIS